MAADTSLLTAENVGRLSRDGTWLLRDVSLSVRGGERWGVSGPTGSGKTLLLRALALLDPIDEGRILFRDATVAHDEVPRVRRRMLYLHQRPALIEGTVEENLRLPYGFKIARGETFDREFVVAELRRLGRDADFLRRETGDLSGGEGQIVALLRAIQLRPDLLLLDEPTSALDAAATEAIEGLVRRWFEESDERRAVLWVSHDPAQVERVADRVLRLKNGRVVE